MRQSIRRGFVVAATSAGLLAFAGGAAQADGLPPLDGTVGKGTSKVTGTLAGTVHGTVHGTARSLPDGPAKRLTHQAGKAAHTLHSTAHRAGTATQQAGSEAGEQIRHVENAVKHAPARPAAGVRDGVEKVVSNGTQKAGEAVSSLPQQASALPAPGTVSGLPVPSGLSAPELPEGTVIEVPAVLPGVPSLGVLPMSVPELPVTPTLPVPGPRTLPAPAAPLP